MMRRFLFFLFFLPVMAWAGKETPAKKLVTLLTECKEREELVPDSFFSDVLLLKQEIREQRDSAAKAVYSATLAHLLMQNQHLSQKWSSETKSHPDSIREWSREEYMQHASDLYKYALRDLDLLHCVPTKEWIPLVKRGKDEKVYGSSMLAVIWQAMYSDIYYEKRKTNGLPLFGTFINFYKERGLREAAFRLSLDSVFETKKAMREAYLLQLKEEYADLPSCDKVYIQLAQLKNTPEKKRQVIEEGLRLYPKSVELKNWITEQETPNLYFRMPTFLYPDSEGEIELEVQNLQSVSTCIYRLPDDFQQDDEQELLTQVLRKGRLVSKDVHAFAPHPPYEKWDDTLHLQMPSLGVYAMVMQANTQVPMEKKPESQVHLFYVSRLRAFSVALPNKRTQIVVVDGQSGKPVPGVSVKLMPVQDSSARKSYTEHTTDERGKAEFYTQSVRNRMKVKLSKDEDCILPEQELNGSSFYNSFTADKNVPNKNLRIFTDRIIYRPGQTVYVGAVAYTQKGWETQVEEAGEYKLTVKDAKGNMLSERILRTDEFGVLNDSVTLPEEAAPGFYTIKIGSTTHSIRVEEYRRPVFYVEMDPVPAVALPVDSIRITGKAITYSGVPVAGARVTGKSNSYTGFWWYQRDLSDSQILDTVYTDAEGRFSVNVSLASVKNDLRTGANFVVDVDVLSKQGETQQGNTRFSLCSRPYVLRGDIPSRQDKERLQPWSFELCASTGAKVEGDILCRIIEGKDTEKASFVLPAGKSVIPSELKNIPTDTRLVEQKDLSIYTPCDTFSVKRPAQVQIGTSLKEAWIYLTMAHHEKVFLDTLICAHDTAFVWEIPYKEEYGDGIRISAALYHKRLNTAVAALRLALPQKELKSCWKTFRNRLRPGQQEEWQLSLRHTDGTPANANVLLSMYDASLDAIRKHKIDFGLSYSYLIPWIRYGQLGGSFSGYNFYFPVRFLKTKDWQFSEYDSNYIYDVFSLQNVTLGTTSTLTGAKNGRTLRLRGAPTAVVMASESAQPTSRSKQLVQVASPLAFESVDQALQGQIAGLDVVNSDLPEGEMRGTKKDAFSELAFFHPTLRTDANGEVKISFTLPESLTSWHLTGFAHDKDLFAALIDETIVAQKELMAELYLPRFLRSGDEASFTASIRNMSERPQQGKANCVIMDAETEKVLARFPVQFRLDASKDTVYTFPVGSVRDNTALLVKWVAEGSDYSDGEQRQLPVLSDLETVTETRAFSVNEKGTSKFNLESLFAHNHPSATNRNMVVEYTARPVWLALKALPSLFTPHCKCVLCTSAAYYATSMAQHILRQVPDADALVDSLHYDGMISLDYRMSLLSSLSALQRADGGFMWFPGMGSNNYLTVEVAYQLARLRYMGVASDAATVVTDRLLKRAMDYLAKDVRKQLKDVKDKKDKQITYHGLRYLYIQSLVDNILTDEQRKDQKLLIELLQPAEGREYTIEEAALAAIVLKRNGNSKLAERYLAGLDKKLTHPDGYYISYPSGSFTSINRKVQTHVQVMEAFQEVKPSERQLLNGMTEWLLQQKRTQQWDEPVKTVNAVYALLLDGSQPLEKGNSDVLKLREGQKTHTFVTPHTSMGYLRDSLSVSVPKELRVEKHERGLSWGAVYATYQMPLDSVRASWQGFHIRREVSSQQPKVGDRLHVRYTITADRDYEFVQLVAPRSAAAEPDASLSGYRYQSGLGYYRMIRDDRTEYYFDSMPKGTYVIEEDWLISRNGNYQTGSTVIRCLYAPEYRSFTDSGRLLVR